MKAATCLSAKTLSVLAILFIGLWSPSCVVPYYSSRSGMASNFHTEMRGMKKILVAAFITDEVTRKFTEDLMASEWKKAYSSYPHISSGRPMESLDSLAKISKEKFGFDGIIVIRMIPPEKRNKYGYLPDKTSLPDYYHQWHKFYRHSEYFSHKVSSRQKRDEHLLETNIYHLASGDLLWNGVLTQMAPSQFTHHETADIIRQTLSAMLKKERVWK